MRWKIKPPVNRDEWHSWFAWRPVITDDMYWVWWERIERRIDFGSYDLTPQYRLAQKPVQIAESLMKSLTEKS